MEITPTNGRGTFTPRSKADTVNELHATFERAQATVNLMLERAIAEGTAGDAQRAAAAAKAAHNASMAMGIAKTKLHELEDRPTQPAAAPARDVRDSLRDLYKRHPAIFWSVGLRITEESALEATYIDRAIADPDQIDQLDAERAAVRQRQHPPQNSQLAGSRRSNVRARERTNPSG